MGRYRSGQTGWTVNPLAHAFSGSNPLLPKLFGSSAVERCTVNALVVGSIPTRTAAGLAQW